MLPGFGRVILVFCWRIGPYAGRRGAGYGEAGGMEMLRSTRYDEEPVSHGPLQS
jgi:hypothetical protein